MAEFERIEKVSYLRIFTHNKNKRKFMISCCDGFSSCCVLRGGAEMYNFKNLIAIVFCTL